MKPYQSVPISNSEEAIVPISADLFILTEPHVYVSLGADYAGRSPYFLRESVLTRLITAQLCLQEKKPHLSFKIFDAYRPIAVQQFMVDYTFAELKTELKGDRQLTPTETEEVWQQVYKFWALPSNNPATPPPHSTGAAIDLTLVDDNGIVVDMGGEIDEIGDRSHPKFYEKSTDPEKQKYHANRELLREAMITAGFAPHPNEWWHFSYGDQLWAWQKGEAIAHYGKI